MDKENKTSDKLTHYQNNLKEIFNSNTGDITIKLSNNEELKVHSKVIMNASNYFNSMCNGKFSEAVYKICDMSKYNSILVKQIFAWIYSSDCFSYIDVISTDNFEQMIHMVTLLELTNMFELKEYNNIVIEEIKKKISDYNVLDKCKFLLLCLEKKTDVTPSIRKVKIYVYESLLKIPCAYEELYTNLCNELKVDSIRYITYANYADIMSYNNVLNDCTQIRDKLVFTVELCCLITNVIVIKKISNKRVCDSLINIFHNKVENIVYKNNVMTVTNFNKEHVDAYDEITINLTFDRLSEAVLHLHLTSNNKFFIKNSRKNSYEFVYDLTISNIDSSHLEELIS